MQHALFVVDNDFWCTQIEQALEAVVAVDDTSVQVVQVGGRETSTVELHHRTKFRRNDRNGVENHGARAVDTATGLVTLVEGSDDLQTLDGLLLTLSRQRLATQTIFDGVAQLHFFFIEVKSLDE